MAINDEIPKSRLTLTSTERPCEASPKTSPSVPRSHHGRPIGVARRPDDASSIWTSAPSARSTGRNLDQVMADMGMSVRVTVPKPDRPRQGRFEDLTADLPIRSIEAVQPRRGREGAVQGPCCAAASQEAAPGGSGEPRKPQRVPQAAPGSSLRTRMPLASSSAELKGFEDFAVPTGIRIDGAADGGKSKKS